MKTCVYFAANSENFQPCLTPGWGFDTAGGLRRGADAPADGVLLDDRFLPIRGAAADLTAALREVPLVVCDFERTPTPALAELVQRLADAGREVVVPEAWAELPHTAVLVGPYRPRVRFARWLAEKRKQYGALVLDAAPISCFVPFGGAPESETGLTQSGEQSFSAAQERFCPGACCLCRETPTGVIFRDTRQTLTARCEPVPAIVFAEAWEALA